MKKINETEMRKVEGGIGVVTALAAAYVGAQIGISARISYEHAKYGRCVTYPRHCNKCKKR